MTKIEWHVYIMPVGPLDELVRCTLTGDAAAWAELQTQVAPQIEAIARSHGDMRSRGLSLLPDDVAEITTATLERLSRSHFQNLERYLAQQQAAGERAAQSFDSWLYGAVDFTIREHLRKRFGRAPKMSSDAAPRAQPSKRDLGTQAGRLDDATDRQFLQTLGMTARLTAAELFAHIESEFGTNDARAMRLYYSEDRSFLEIAQTLGLEQAKDAERLIRKLNARLRYEFANDGTQS